MNNIISALLLFLLIIPAPYRQEPRDILGLQVPLTYYVSMDGNDTNFGTFASPFRTIQKCANIANVGNRCLVSAGNYNQNVTVTRSNITFEAVGKVVIKQFYVKGAADVTVIGFYSKDSDALAGGFLSTGPRTKFLNNVADGACRAGFVVEAPGYILDGNEVFGSRQCGTSGPDADGMRALARDGIITNNYIHNIVKNSTTNSTAHVDCIQGDFGSYEFINILIQGNICDVADAGVQTDGNNCDDVRILDNTFRAARPLNMECSNMRVEGNIMYGKPGSSFASLRAGSFNVTFKNNVVCNTSDGIIADSLAVPDNGGGGNIFWNTSGTAPRRDSGYSYKNGKLRFPTDKWQTENPLVCGSFVPPVPTGTPTVTKTPVSPTLTATPSLPPVFTGTASVVPPTLTRTPTRTATVTRTVTQTSTPSITPSITMTPTPTTPITRTVTFTPRPVTPTPTPSFNRCDFNRDGRVSWSEFFRCIFG